MNYLLSSPQFYIPCTLSTPPKIQHFEFLGGDRNLDLNARFNINTRNLLDDFTWRM